jgi:hypothetical protein
MRSSDTGRLALSTLLASLMFAAAGCGASSQPQPVGESSGHNAPTASTAQAAYTGPSWSEYIKTQPGQSCVLVGDEYHVAGDNIAAYLTQAVVSSAREAAGERVIYRVTTRVTNSEPGATVLPPVSYLLPYDFQADGKLGTAPGPTSEPGLKVRWEGSELYPSIDELRAGKSATSSVVLSAKVTEAAAQRALEKELQPGQTEMKIRYAITAGPAPPLASIQTRDGTFTNVVGVKTQFGSGEVVNANAADTAKLGSVLTSFGKVFSGTVLYFARGVGMVDSTSPLGDSKLDSCSG